MYEDPFYHGQPYCQQKSRLGLGGKQQGEKAAIILKAFQAYSLTPKSHTWLRKELGSFEPN